MKLKKVLSLSLCLMFLFQASIASAYSYGKPDEEAIANVYTVIYAELQKSSPDWNKMSAQFQTVKAEIANPHHYGAVSPQIAAYLEKKIAAKDRTGIIDNYKALLVLNIERRLKFTEQSFTKYNDAKLILAKGYATFRELRPTITNKIPNATLADLDKSFNIMVDEALGNPGLFGVGKKAPNKALFDTHQNKILNTLKPKFPLNLSSASTNKGIVLTINQSKATINGKSSSLDAAPFIQSGRTYVPVRFVSEALGAKVGWDAKTRVVSVTSGSKSIKLTIGSKTAVRNGSRVTLDAPAQIKNGRTFVPVRVVSEVLGYKVNWNASAKTVQIQ